MSLVSLTLDGGVAIVTLNRPEKLNALTPAMFQDLRDAIGQIKSDQSIGCVVLAGAGRSFCAGHDLGDLAAGNAMDFRYFEAETIDLLESLPQPTVAKIHGHCLTGGLELALACDLLVAADTARIGDTHGKWGVVPVWGMSVRLPERVGISTARLMMFTSRVIDGTAAKAIGLVDIVASTSELDPTVADLANEILRNSAGSNRMAKALLAAHRGSTRGEALRFERKLPFGMPEDSAERLASSGERSTR